MRFGVLRHAHVWLGRIGAWSVGIGGLCVLVAEKFGDPMSAIGLQVFHGYLKHIQGWFTPTMTAFGGLALFFQRRLGNPMVWDEIDGILNELNLAVFPDKRKDFNRVTLFKRCSFSWLVILKRQFPFGPWLCPVARSSHVSRWTWTRFRVKDSGEFEGIAGKAWTQHRNILVEGLPDLTDATDQDRLDYIERTHSSPDYIASKGKNCPRSIFAIPIETRTDRAWGVLVFDSLEPQLDQEAAVRMFETYAKLLGHLL